jgi:aryl-phospho-beta-D-glucosidase BglC (GH1 family)
VDVAIATPLSTIGRFIVDATETRVRLAGVNWYGASEDIGVPAGLDTIDRNLLAQLIAGFGFNCVRFPFSVWMTQQTAPVPDQYLAGNPDLSGSTPIQVYDACVQALTAAGLMVIPNCHLLDFGWCCSDQDDNGLWFNDRWTEETFTATWQEVVKRYSSNDMVVAMDVKNEPRPATVGGRLMHPTWGPGDRTDFGAMYTTIGNVIHGLNPHLLIICEGLGYATDLSGVASHPVQLTQANKVVYSMHDYSWFHAQGQSQAAYTAQMNKVGGYILSQNIAPLWIGEFGDTVSSLASAGSVGWWANIQAWLTDNDIDWCWWALNPTHAKGSNPGTATVKYHWGQPEPYGLLTPDWDNAASPDVMTVLQAMMPPRTGPGVPVS